MKLSAELLAQRFHETYEKLAPTFGYETRRESAKPWEDVPAQNKALMIAVCEKILQGEVLYEQRLTGLFETLRGRYPEITTIENGLEAVFDEREKLYADIREIAGELEETARLPELTDAEKRTWRAVKNRLLALTK